MSVGISLSGTTHNMSNRYSVIRTTSISAISSGTKFVISTPPSVMPHTLLPNGRKLTFRSKYAVQVPAPREGHIPDVALHARRFKSPMMTC